MSAPWPLMETIVMILILIDVSISHAPWRDSKYDLLGAIETSEVLG